MQKACHGLRIRGEMPSNERRDTEIAKGFATWSRRRVVVRRFTLGRGIARPEVYLGMSNDARKDNPTEQPPAGRNAVQDERIAHMRDEGASWLQIQQEFDLTRQQARYGYQRGKREERRSQRRSS
jgi:hypothetical protein